MKKRRNYGYPQKTGKHISLIPCITDRTKTDVVVVVAVVAVDVAVAVVSVFFVASSLVIQLSTQKNSSLVRKKIYFVDYAT